MEREWAVITGASGGLGEAYARELARQGADVFLVARNEAELQRVAADLRRDHGVSTEVLPVDLTDHDARAQLVARLDDLRVHTLVNNAGFGTLGDLASIDRARITREVNLNVLALTELTHAVVPQMLGRGRGAVVNVASTAAFQPIPRMATYAATKAYVLRFSIGLWGELRGTGVRVTAICPGPTETSFFANAGDAEVMGRRRTPEQVVAATFAALRAGQPYVVDGLLNKALAQANRITPTALATRLATWVATH